MDTFEFLCCFCNQTILENITDPISIDSMHNEDLLNKTGCKQLFEAHFDCLKERLHPYFKTYFIRLKKDDNQEPDFF